MLVNSISTPVEHPVLILIGGCHPPEIFPSSFLRLEYEGEGSGFLASARLLFFVTWKQFYEVRDVKFVMRMQISFLSSIKREIRIDQNERENLRHLKRGR